MAKIESGVKVDFTQIDVSEELRIKQSSELELCEYIKGLRSSIENLTANLFSMHSEMKEFGNELKKSKKDNQKAVKDSSKTVNASTKKADKLRKSDKESDNESRLIAIQRERSDFQCYEFCLKFSTKKFKSNITSVYTICDSVMGKRIDLKTKQKNKTHVNVKLNSKKPSKDKEASQPDGYAINNTLDDLSNMEDFKKSKVQNKANKESNVVRFQTNPEYREYVVGSPISKFLLIFS